MSIFQYLFIALIIMALTYIMLHFYFIKKKEKIEYITTYPIEPRQLSHSLLNHIDNKIRFELKYENFFKNSEHWDKFQKINYSIYNLVSLYDLNTLPTEVKEKITLDDLLIVANLYKQNYTHIAIPLTELPSISKVLEKHLKKEKKNETI